MSKPIIGISGSIIIDQGGMFPGYKRSYVNDDYIDSVVQAGGIPFIIPTCTDKNVIKEQIQNIDALILSGGHDITPYFYGEEPHQKLGEILPDRDKFDFQLLREAEQKQIPILGICRGAQIISVYHGGSLYQDLSEHPALTIKHDQHQTPELETHSVTIESGSLFEQIFQTNTMHVNSFHHQIINKLPKHLKAQIHACDGVIEGFINTDYSNVELAVQWHPEMLHRTNQKMMNLFKFIINQARKDDV